MKMTIVSSAPHGACSFYRSHGVFPKLDIITKPAQDIGWQSLMDTDILFFERPDSKEHLKAGEIAKDLNVKLWVDFDDNLFCLPETNPNQAYYNSRSVQSTIIKNIMLADIITVATTALSAEMEYLEQNIEIVPNAFNDYNFDFEYNLSNNNIIIWRGSDTHRGDLMAYSKQIWDIAESSKWNWEFIGRDLWFITDRIKRKNILPELNLPVYFRTIKTMNPAIYIVPLEFNNFNLSKSNCGWLEMTFAGAVTLAPNTPEWRKPGIINYDNPEHFQNKLELLMSDKSLRKINYEKSFEYIRDNLLLSIVNEKRAGIIENTFRGRKKCGKTIKFL